MAEKRSSTRGNRGTPRRTGAVDEPACLDPRLELAAARGRREDPGALAAEMGAASHARIVSPRTLAGMALGQRSLATRSSMRAARRMAETDEVPVLVHLDSDADDVADAQRKMDQVRERVEGLKGSARRLSTTTMAATVPRDALRRLAALSGVRFVEANSRLRPHLDKAHRSANLSVPGGWTVTQTGSGVLVGVIDTGIDATHPAFGEGAGSRIVDYLDQQTDTHYTQADIQAGRAAASPDTDGHGTHVAGIAAGDGASSPAGRYVGVAPNAELVVVKTTFDTVEIAAGLAHVFEVADRLGKPCVVNMSLGGHAGAHDGSSVLERTIDELSGRGRVVVVSAGNEGRHNIHASKEFDEDDGEWTAHLQLIPQVWEGTQMGSLDLQVWVPWESDPRVRLRSPNGRMLEAPRGGTRSYEQAKFIVDATHQRAAYSRDHRTTFAISTVAEAQWLRGWSLIVTPSKRKGVARGCVHAWIEDGDSGAFTSGHTKSHLVGMPGTAFSAITVASYATRESWTSRDVVEATVLEAMNLEDISYFSSPGPTRDGHNKPEIAAPGQYLLAPLSSAAADDEVPPWQRVKGRPYAAMQGTSMAAPYVTGALALLFEKNPDLDWAEVKRRLIKSARHDAHAACSWNPRWGYGKLDVERLLTVEPF